MSSASVGLIRMLAGGVRAFGPDEPAAPGNPVGFDFESMLGLAGKGKLRSGSPVRLARGFADRVGAEMLGQLATAADTAAAEGITRALVMIEERMFRLDVLARTVIDAPDHGAEVIAGIDGVVRRGAPAELRPDSRGELGPARVVRNASLIDALAGMSCTGD
jgi:hypothetical protein